MLFRAAVFVVFFLTLIHLEKTLYCYTGHFQIMGFYDLYLKQVSCSPDISKLLLNSGNCPVSLLISHLNVHPEVQCITVDFVLLYFHFGFASFLLHFAFKVRTAFKKPSILQMMHKTKILIPGHCKL